nr:unnamed protein product [Digitaria exilis]
MERKVASHKHKKNYSTRPYVRLRAIVAFSTKHFRSNISRSPTGGMEEAIFKQASPSRADTEFSCHSPPNPKESRPKPSSPLQAGSSKGNRHLLDAPRDGILGIASPSRGRSISREERIESKPGQQLPHPASPFDAWKEPSFPFSSSHLLSASSQLAHMRSLMAESTTWDRDSHRGPATVSGSHMRTVRAQGGGGWPSPEARMAGADRVEASGVWCEWPPAHATRLAFRRFSFPRASWRETVNVSFYRWPTPRAVRPNL